MQDTKKGALRTSEVCHSIPGPGARAPDPFPGLGVCSSRLPKARVFFLSLTGSQIPAVGARAEYTAVSCVEKAPCICVQHPEP